MLACCSSLCPVICTGEQEKSSPKLLKQFSNGKKHASKQLESSIEKSVKFGESIAMNCGILVAAGPDPITHLKGKINAEVHEQLHAQHVFPYL